MPPPAEDIAYLRAKMEALEVAVQLSREEHRQGCEENRSDHTSIVKRLAAIETKPMIVLGDDIIGVCRYVTGVSVIGLMAWLAWLFRIHN